MAKRKLTEDEKKTILERNQALHPNARIVVHDETDEDGLAIVTITETSEMPSDWTPPDA
jgi:hypothetical protein